MSLSILRVGHQGGLRVVAERLPRVLLRRSVRSLVHGIRHHLVAFFSLLLLVVISLLVVTRLSTSDNWESLDYVFCMFGFRRFGNKLPSNRLRVFPLSRSWTDPSDCLPLPTTPSPIICVHSADIDRFISGAIRDGTVWEVETVRLFLELLTSNPTLGVIDIGANIGQYSLLAASMRRHVVAVEPYIKHVRMLHKAVVLNKLEENMTLIQNAVSDSNRLVSLQFKKDNRGAIRIVESNTHLQTMLNRQEETCVPSETSVWTVTLNDLLEVTRFKQVLLKIDIEGHEVKAMLRSGLFMEKLHIPFIIMEWVFMRNVNDEYKAQSVQELVDYLMKYDYEAFSTSKRPLNMTSSAWLTWPQDIIWKLATVYFI